MGLEIDDSRCKLILQLVGSQVVAPGVGGRDGRKGLLLHLGLAQLTRCFSHRSEQVSLALLGSPLQQDHTHYQQHQQHNHEPNQSVHGTPVRLICNNMYSQFNIFHFYKYSNIYINIFVHFLLLKYCSNCFQCIERFLYFSINTKTYVCTKITSTEGKLELRCSKSHISERLRYPKLGGN